MIGANDEALRPSTGEGFADAVTFSWGDRERGLFGTARLGVVPGETPVGSALAVLFSGDGPVSVRAQGEVELADPGWDALEVAGLRTETIEPLAQWRIRFKDPDGAFDLRFSALSAPLEYGEGSPATRAGALPGYEQLCRVEGRVRTPDGEREVSCLGQRGHWWGVADWSRVELARSVSAWLSETRAVALHAVRPEGVELDGEIITAFLLDGTGVEGEPAPVADPRLSTTYDGEGRQRRAGIELWVTDDDDALPRRAAGEVLCGTTIDLGRLRLDCAFFSWGMEGLPGVGAYDVLRRQ